MNKATFTFHAELHFFLPLKKRGASIECSFKENQSVKHLIESLGVPHTELGAVTVNNQPVSLDYIAQNGDQIVQPATSGCQVEVRFALDNHLGRLAAYLRALGFDCLYKTHYDDRILAELSASEARILLTRDRRLLMRKIVRYGYCPRSLEPKTQLREVIQRFNLVGQMRPFHRCLRCNGLLEPISKQAVLRRLQPLTKKYYHEFHVCRACKQVYWKGSHYQRLNELFAEILPEK